MTLTPEEITAIQAENARLKGANTELDGRVKTFETKIGNRNLDKTLADADALAEAVRQRDELAAERAKNGTAKDFDAEVERRAGAVRDEFAPVLSEKEKLINTQAAELKELRVVDAVISKVGDKIYPKALEDFKGIIRVSCDKDDKGNIVIKGADGKVRYSPTTPSVPMSLDEFIVELQDKKDFLFANRTPGGGHDAANKGGGGGSTGEIDTWEQYSKLSPADAAKLVLKPHIRSKIFAEARAAGVKFGAGF